MWFVFSVAALLSYAAADLFGKKNVDTGGAEAPTELLITLELLQTLTALTICVLGLGESGRPPWRLLGEYPLIYANLVSFILYWFLFLLSMRYVGLTVDEAVSGAFGVFYFVGLLLVHLVSGRLAAVRDMLHPLRLIPILLVLVFTVLLPNIEVIAHREDPNLREMAKSERRRTVLGLLILLAALALDSVDSLVTTLVCDETDIGTVDYIMTSFFSASIALVPFAVYYRVKNRRWFIPFRRGSRRAVRYAAPAMLSSVLYMAASSFDAVRTGILFLAYPIVPILGAKLFLKEKYTRRQNFCIWTVTLAAIAFCAVDPLL